MMFSPNFTLTTLAKTIVVILVTLTNTFTISIYREIKVIGADDLGRVPSPPTLTGGLLGLGAQNA